MISKIFSAFLISSVGLVATSTTPGVIEEITPCVDEEASVVSNDVPNYTADWPEYFFYDYSLRDDLLSIPANDFTGLYFPIAYQSFNATRLVDLSEEQIDITIEINEIRTSYEYISTSGFEPGYWTRFNGFRVNITGTCAYNEVYYQSYLPIDSFTSNGVQLGGNLQLRMPTYITKSNLESGTLTGEAPYTRYSLSVTNQVYVSGSPTGLQLYLRIQLSSSLTENSIIETQIPISSIIPNYQSLGLTFTNIEMSNAGMPTNIFSMPFFFTYIRNFTFDSYVEGYNAGEESGYREGYNAGYVEGLRGVNVDFTDWLGSAASGFLGFEIIPGLSLFSILSFIISLGLLFLILRFFSGG